MLAFLFLRSHGFVSFVPDVIGSRNEDLWPQGSRRVSSYSIVAESDFRDAARAARPKQSSHSLAIAEPESQPTEEGLKMKVLMTRWRNGAGDQT